MKLSKMEDAERELHAEDVVRIRIGPRHRNAKLSTIPDKCAYKAKLKKYLKSLKKFVERGIGLMLMGPLGAGKTAAAAIVAKAVAAHYGYAFMIRADDLQKAAIEKTDFDDYRTVWDRMKEVDLLVIDDVGSDHAKEFGIGVFESIVRWRYDRKLATVVTTNKSVKELTKVYGEGLVKVMERMMVKVIVEGTTWHEQEVKEINDLFNKTREEETT